MNPVADFKIHFEWENGSGVRGEELAATWANFEILVDKVPLTKLEDARAQSIRERLTIPLLPLAEWFAGNWWSLWFEGQSHTTIKY